MRNLLRGRSGKSPSASRDDNSLTGPGSSAPPKFSSVDEAADLRAVLDVLPIGVVVCNNAGVATVTNAKAKNLLDDYQGNALLKATIDNVVNKALKSEYSEEMVELHGVIGQAMAIESRPLTEGGTVILVEDISERRRIDAVRRDFVANVSHELRTPIGALTLLTESLVLEKDPEAIARINEHIASEARRAAHLVEELLNLSNIETPKGHSFNSILVPALLDEAVELVRPQAQKHQVDVEIAAADSAAVVWGDRSELLSALTNLLENAIKYSDDGATIHLSATATKDECSFRVKDNGIGIPAIDLDRVFERFYRVDRARSRNTGGAGLGLAIVRHVATNHHGNVSVTSREGEGSTFTLTIPIAL